MKEELTTLMQAEFMENELTQVEMLCLAVYSCIAKGESKAEALKANNLTAEEYDSKIYGALRRI